MRLDPEGLGMVWRILLISHKYTLAYIVYSLVRCGQELVDVGGFRSGRAHELAMDHGRGRDERSDTGALSARRGNARRSQRAG